MLNNQKIIEQLTLAEKAALTTGQSTWQTYAVADKIPAIFMADGPHGLRKQTGATDHLGLNASEPATCFPTAATLANSWDENLIGQVGAALGNEARALDVQVVLGPGLNIKRNPRCGRDFEYYSEDPYLAGKMGAAMIRGIQSTGTFASPKHFAANNQEYRRMASNSLIDERTLRELYLTNFEIAVKEGKPRVLMSAYNEINGIYAHENKYLLEDILRKEWGFKGFVVSDWGGDNDHVAAVQNGGNLAMPTLGANGPLEIIQAVKSGELAEETLNQRVDELLTQILQSTAGKNTQQQVDWSHQHQVAHKAAAESIVLLKNKAATLPLADTTKVALIGDFAKQPRYQGAGSSLVNAQQVENMVATAVDQPITFIGYEQGYQRNGIVDHELSAAAVALANKSDVAVICAGLDEISESEGLDRTDLKLPDNQVELINTLAQTSTPIIVVLSAGSVIEMPWLDKVAAVVHGYLGGEAGASAMWDVLIGKQNPSGKLAETYPLTYEDVPFGKEYPTTQRDVYYKEGPFVGYRYYTTAEKPVRFPFGFGLSYTTFAYSDLHVASSGVTAMVKNTGEREGNEVVQLYIGKSDSQLIRPRRELKGFTKVHLAPGEAKQINIRFDDKAFRYFDVTSNSWQVEAGTYDILIGASVDDIRLRGTIVEAGQNVAPALNLVHYRKADLSQVTLADFSALYGQTLPAVKTEIGQQLAINSTIAEMRYAKNWLARQVYRYLKHALAKSEAKGKPDLNLLFIYNMPFRAIAKMTNGQVSLDMVNAILRMVNGHFWSGLTRLINHYFKNRKQNKVWQKEMS